MTQRKRKFVVASLLLVAFVFVAGGLDAWSHLRSARAHLQRARLTLRGVLEQPGELADPVARARVLERARLAHREARSAREAVDQSIALTVLRHVPVLGRQPHAARLIASDAVNGAAAAVTLLEQVQRLSERASLENGRVPMPALEQLQDAAEREAARFRGMNRSQKGLIGTLGTARKQLNQLAGIAESRLTRMADGIGAAQSILGAHQPQTFLVAAENNAEMRNRGMVLSYATMHADNGKLTTTGFGSIADLKLEAPVAVDVPAGTAEVFGGLLPTKSWHGVNATDDFSWSARVMSEMYRAKTKRGVDGVIGIDVVALAKLLDVVGPVSVPGVPTEITGANATRVLLNDLYSGLAPDDDKAARHGTLGAVAGAVVERLTDGNPDLFALGKALATAAGGNHLRLWTSDERAERDLERFGLGGGSGAINPDRTFHVAVQNGSGNKVDYFVRPQVAMRVRLGRTGTAVVDTTVTVPNTAPVGAQPSYQLGPYLNTQLSPGDYVARAYLWAPSRAVALQAVPESGLRLMYSVLDVPPGQSRTFRFRTTIPRAVRRNRLELRLVPQPRLEPMRLRVVLDAPGWRVEEPSTIEREWDTTIVARWSVVR